MRTRLSWRNARTAGHRPPGCPARGPGAGGRMDAVNAEVHAVYEVDDVLRRELMSCWTDVANAGGAGGPPPPGAEDVVAPGPRPPLGRGPPGLPGLAPLPPGG